LGGLVKLGDKLIDRAVERSNHLVPASKLVLKLLDTRAQAVKLPAAGRADVVTVVMAVAMVGGLRRSIRSSSEACLSPGGNRGLSLVETTKSPAKAGLFLRGRAPAWGRQSN